MSARINGKTITVARGEDASFSLKPVDFTFEEGSLIQFTVRRRPDDKDRLIYKEVPTDFPDEEGLLWVRIDRSDTINLDFGRYAYDLWVIENGKNRPMITDGILAVTTEVRDLRGGNV